MNILLIDHYAGSQSYGMEYRAYYLAKEWVNQGHKVTIVAATFSHLRLKNPSVDKDYQVEMIDGIKYIWLKTPSYEGSLKRIMNMGIFVRKLNKYAKRLSQEEQPNLVIAGSCYPLDNYAAHKIAKMSNAKYTYEVRDIWPLSPKLIGGYSDHHPFIWVMQRAEDYAYKHVDKVVSLLWNAEGHMLERGLTPGKFVCVPNGYYPEEWTEDKFSLPLPEEHQKAFDSLKDKIIVGFAGGLAASGALLTLLQTAKELTDNTTIHFVLVGKGPEEQTLRQYASENYLNNITFLPAVPKVSIPSIIKHFDIAYYGGYHSPLHKYGTCANKLTDYMLAAKPIIQAIDEPGSVVSRVGCGMQVEAENPQKNAQAILSIVALTEKERKNMGIKGKEYAEKNYTWNKLSKDFLDAFK